jgi:hypothetical protein
MQPRKIVHLKTVQHALKLAKTDVKMYETLGSRQTPSFGVLEELNQALYRRSPFGSRQVDVFLVDG